MSGKDNRNIALTETGARIMLPLSYRIYRVKEMTYEQGAELMCSALKGIHGRFKKMYGQIALRLDERSYLLTGGNKLMSEIGEESFVVCDISTGDLGEIFRSRPDINAILFGITQDMVVVSQKGIAVRTALEDIAQLTGAELKVVTETTPEAILKALSDTSVCLVQGTGGIAVGSNLKKAVAGIQIVEKACEAEIHGRLIGYTVPLDEETAESYRKEFRYDYVNRNEEDQVPFVGFEEEEFSLRSRLIEAGKDLVKNDLSYGSWGNLSVRLNEDEMLITPSSMDYFEIKPEDIVRLNINTLEYTDPRIPSGESLMHAALYRQQPECGAVIHTHSNGISVFAACEAGFAVSEPDVRALIGNVKVTGYARPGSPELAGTVAETMSDTHAAIIPHHGAVFTGQSLDDAFAIAEAVEIRARNLLGFDSWRPEEEAEEE